MKKIIILFLAVAALLISCHKTISADQYIGAMAALGCNNVAEGTPEAGVVFKGQGITNDDIWNFRKNMDSKIVTKVVNEIAKRVAACHGVTQSR